jgi:transcriptional regulator with XRE-family HTH domain
MSDPSLPSVSRDDSDPGGSLEKFGRAVFRARKQSGLTQRQLASRSKIDEKAISAIERGLRNPTLRTIVNLASGLGVPPVELLRNEGESDVGEIP